MLGTIFWTAIIVLAALDFVLKGFALWHSGRNNQLGWFVALFILNTLGILPLIYLLFFRKKKGKK